MDKKETALQFIELLSEASAVKSQIGHLTKRQAALQRTISGYIELFPEFVDIIVQDFDDPELLEMAGSMWPERTRWATPRGQQAVRRVLVESPGRFFTVQDMVAALREHGWMPDTVNPNSPSPAVRTALERLSGDKASKVLKGGLNGRVAWSYQPNAEVT